MHRIIIGSLLFSIMLGGAAAAQQCPNSVHNIATGNVAKAQDIIDKFNDILNCGALATNPSFNSNILGINSPATGQQAGVGLYSAGAIKWQFGKNTDDSFFLYDDIAGRSAIWAGSNGNLGLMPSGGYVGVGTTAPQQNLSVNAGAVIDQAGTNSGAPDLTFGSNSGEGIGSQRTAGSGQYSLAFYVNYANRMFIQSGTGNIGIGTTTPNGQLDIAKNPGNGYLDGIVIGQLDGDNSESIQTYIDTGAGGGYGNWGYASGCCHPLNLQPHGGKVGIGTTGPWATLSIQSPTGDLALNGTGGGATGQIQFYDNGTLNWSLFGWHSNIFWLQNNGSTTNMWVVGGQNSWSLASDVRLKQNIKTVSVLERLDGYRAVSFDWKKTGKHDLGVVAQELYKVFPEVVNKGSEGALSGEIDPSKTWSVQYDKLGALALEAVKELKIENDRLRAANDNQRRDVTALIKAVHEQQNEIIGLKQEVAALQLRKVTASNER